MEISQHIKDLLFTQDRVILSGFGVFIAKYSPAKINEETKTISPPAKEILFDSKIIKDGGLLENHMAKREKISFEEARKQIDEYVKTVISKLNAGKKVKFPELGTFTKIKEGSIIFLYQPTGNLLLDSYGLPKISLPEKILTVSKETKTHRTKRTKSNNRWIIWTAIPIAIALIFAAIYFIKPDIWNKGKNYVTALFIKTNTKDTTNNITKDTIIVNNTTENNNVAENNNENNNAQNDNENSNENQNAINPENNVNPGNNVKPENNNNSSGDFLNSQKGKFYLIIGSLPTQKLADKESRRLKKMGINSSIIAAGKNKYRLSIGEFDNSREATAFYEDFHTKYKNINPWLWENK